jgi:hypothetical protein
MSGCKGLEGTDAGTVKAGEREGSRGCAGETGSIGVGAFGSFLRQPAKVVSGGP